ncbi:peptidase T [Facklamia sp. HMSC062C11]|uniref:peptidase T n=1 Tax=Facklamia sp. HMSC062C11 TaxID=1739262 RepID=UPI0008A45307|nr:peptidase T [Facklamia sp. HMSC062C11]OFL64986.1 peptidase T [Facklamia sp. HMSC062C11]
MDFFEEVKERFIRYAKINTRSDETSETIPSTERQFDLLNLLVEELQAMGMEEVELNPSNAFVTATLPANCQTTAPSIGFISHVDTADFNSEKVNPQIHSDYQGQVISLNDHVDLSPEEFPSLLNYKGQTLITTDGTTLLGADDKSGIAEIMTAMDYLIKHPEIKHGKVRVAFGPDEEIGRGADHFDAEGFGVDFAYTMDGGPVGELQYESFNAAQAVLKIQGKNIHPGTAKGKMINAVMIASEFIRALPSKEAPEYTEGHEGFYHVLQIQGTVDEAMVQLIIRDFDREQFQARKDQVTAIVDQINQAYDHPVVELSMKDEYYNMAEVIKKDMTPVDLAQKAMESLDIPVDIKAIRGGTDGSKISFMGIPTPNIFAGGENMHGRYEYVAVESMIKAAQVIIKIVELNAQA